VLGEIARAPDPRFREVMSAFVRHLHGFAREVRLTEEEFQRACATIVALGQRTTESHNEPYLWRLARLLDPHLPPQQWRQRPDRNHGEPTGAVLASRLAAHRKRRLDRAVADAGVPIFVDAWIKDVAGNPVPAPRSMSGIPPRKATTRTRTPRRPT